MVVKKKASVLTLLEFVSTNSKKTKKLKSKNKKWSGGKLKVSQFGYILLIRRYITGT